MRWRYENGPAYGYGAYKKNICIFRWVKSIWTTVIERYLYAFVSECKAQTNTEDLNNNDDVACIHAIRAIAVVGRRVLEYVRVS